MPTFIEKREYQRQNVCIPIQFVVADTDTRYSAEIINLSKNGVYLTAPTGPEVGNRITLIINTDFSDDSRSAPALPQYSCHAKVKTCHILPKSRDVSYGVGVTLYDTMPDKDWAALFPSSDFTVKATGDSSETLRKRAENFISKDTQTIFKLKPESIQQLVHELSIHQIELQMQGEELRQAHSETEVALSQYADLYDFAPVGYFTLNRAGIIQKVNMTGAALLGVERGRLVDRPFMHHILKKDHDIFWHHRRAVMHTDTRQTCEIRLRDRAGNLIYAQLQSIVEPYKEDAERKIFSAVIDITDRKLTEQHRAALEERLTEAKKLEAIGTLAGGVAHDFNNLMMAIQGSVAVMRLDLGENHAHARYLAGIDAEIRRAANLTRQLLAFARGGKYEVRPIDINALIQSGIELFSRTHKEITIETDLQENVAAVVADSSQLENVFLNLFINAGDAMLNNGRLEIRTEAIALDDAQAGQHRLPTGEYIRISVTDSGMGMDEATRKRIFEPFFTTKTINRGTGLGLASAYGTIRNHNGHLTVRSQPGKGATFVIYLPTAGEKAAIIVKEGLKVQKGFETLLVVDDEPVVRRTVTKMLEHLGYTVLEAANGEEAIARFRKDRDRIDLVILDMTMPGLDGGETFDRLQALDADVKVLLASGYSLQGKAEAIIKRGCGGFIQKPYTLMDFSNTLRTLLDPS